MGAVAQLPLPPQPQSSQNPPHDVSCLQMELEALTSAAQAKDASLASLEARLRSALESAKADRAKFAEALSRSDVLQKELQESREREQTVQKQLQQMKVQLENVEAAEERLASQLGELEAEFAEQDREQNALIHSLRSRLQEKEALLAATRAKLEDLCQNRASHDDSEKNARDDLAKGPRAVQALEERLAKAELLLRRTQSELLQSRRKAGKLQRDLDDSEAVRARQEETTTRLQRGKEAAEGKKPLLMGEAAGVKFWFKAPASIVVRKKAIEA